MSNTEACTLGFWKGSEKVSIIVSGFESQKVDGLKTEATQTLAWAKVLK